MEDQPKHDWNTFSDRTFRKTPLKTGCQSRKNPCSEARDRSIGSTQRTLLWPADRPLLRAEFRSLSLGWVACSDRRTVGRCLPLHRAIAAATEPRAVVGEPFAIARESSLGYCVIVDGTCRCAADNREFEEGEPQRVVDDGYLHRPARSQGN